MKKEVKRWFEQAKKDFDTAKYNLEGGETDAGIFFLQQSAEKSLKALYIKKFDKLLRTHDLILLSKKIGAPKKILEYCKKLNPAYQYTRYPDVPAVENLANMTDDFVNYVEEILEWIKKNI